MRENAPSVVLIVLTYNAREVARRCLVSLRRLTYANLQVVVVDNASSDGTESMVRSEFVEFECLQTGANLGYTGGNNRGLEIVLKRDADYALILNPDTVIINPHFLEEMVSHLEDIRDIGIAGPRVFLRERGTVQNTVLFTPGLWRSLRNWIGYRLNPGSYELSGDKERDAETLNGVCLLLRTKCLREIGLFDENIFMYIEDADLDHRARLSGWRVRYLPIDSVVHEQRLDGYEMTSLVSFLLRRNSVYFLNKFGRSIDAWGYAIGSLLMMVIRGLAHPQSLAEYWRFSRRLSAAYAQILRRLPLDEKFGPPYA
ncbi:MAG: glycosyltransferase family 2 protein [Acidobacteriota bacterium]